MAQCDSEWFMSQRKRLHKQQSKFRSSKSHSQAHNHYLFGTAVLAAHMKTIYLHMVIVRMLFMRTRTINETKDNNNTSAPSESNKNRCNDNMERKKRMPIKTSNNKNINMISTRIMVIKAHIRWRDHVAGPNNVWRHATQNTFKEKTRGDHGR